MLWYSFIHRSYVPRATANHAVQDDDQQTETGYYTPMSYIYPNSGPQHPPQQHRPTNVENTTTANTATAADDDGLGETSTFGHGYDYITVQK